MAKIMSATKPMLHSTDTMSPDNVDGRPQELDDIRNGWEDRDLGERVIPRRHVCNGFPWLKLPLDERRVSSPSSLDSGADCPSPSLRSFLDVEEDRCAMGAFPAPCDPAVVLLEMVGQAGKREWRHELWRW